MEKNNWQGTYLTRCGWKVEFSREITRVGDVLFGLLSTPLGYIHSTWDIRNGKSLGDSNFDLVERVKDPE